MRLRHPSIVVSLLLAVSLQPFAQTAKPSLWTYSAVFETPKWQDFVEKIRSEYLFVLPDGYLQRGCEALLDANPVPVSDDGPGLCIAGLLGGLDEQSSYVSPQKYAEQQAARRNPWVGIGLELGAKQIGQGLKVVTPFEGAPGERAGVRAGDLLLAVDGKDLRPLTMDQCIEALRGEEGSAVRLTLHRSSSSAPIELTAVRAKIRVLQVRARMLTSDAAYVRIGHFNAHVPEELDRFLLPLRRGDSSSPNALVLDLRGNNGGLLEVLPDIAGIFAPIDQPVLESRGRVQTQVLRTRQHASTSAHGWTQRALMVVLVDERTASGAEALAQFLRESRGARILGERTSGSTLVTTGRQVGGDALVWLATAEMSSPQGVRWRKGLTPDLTLERAAEKHEYGDARDPWLEAALRALNEAK